MGRCVASTNLVCVKECEDASVDSEIVFQLNAEHYGHSDERNERTQSSRSGPIHGHTTHRVVWGSSIVDYRFRCDYVVCGSFFSPIVYMKNTHAEGEPQVLAVVH